MSPISTPLPILFSFFLFLISTTVFAANLSVISHPSKLQLPLGDMIENSPGCRTGSVVACNRIQINGLSRLHHLKFYAHSLNIRILVTQGDALFRIQTVEICSHKNAAIGVGMCSSTQWKKLSMDSYVFSVSPFENRILDVRALPDPSRSIKIFTEQEFMLLRVILLGMGLVMMITTTALSESGAFYYGSAMAIGFIIILRVHLQLGIFLLVCLALAGAWFGNWGVRKLVHVCHLAMDSAVAYFVEWTVLIFSVAMILQSSLDTHLAVQALILAIMIRAIARTEGKSRFLCHEIKKMLKGFYSTQDQISPTRYQCHNPGLIRTSHYYSTYHYTHEVMKFSKEEWQNFTIENTREALRELVSSPDFHQWAVDNAERITLTTPEVGNRFKRRHLLQWFRAFFL